MWKVLGKEALYLDIAPVWKERMLELAGDDEKAKKFKEIVQVSEVTSLFNASSLEHAFFIRVDDAVTPEDIQICADVTLDILKSVDFPIIECEGVKQNYQVNITNWHEPEIIGLNKTEGMSSGQVFMPIINSLNSPGKLNSRFGPGGAGSEPRDVNGGY